MLRSMLASLPPEDYRYLQDIGTIISDIAEGTIAIDLLPWGLEFNFLLASIHSVETVIPTNNLDDQDLVSSKFEQYDISLPQLCRLCNPDGKYGQYGNDVSPLLFYAEEIRYSIRSCYKQYFRSKISGETMSETVGSLLQRVQERLTAMEEFPLFLDMLEMDGTFMLKKSRPAGRFYSENGIDPLWRHFSDTLLLSLNGDPIERTVQPNATLEEQKIWFKKTTGLRRRVFYLKHLQNLILLNMLETAVHGYSTRDGADFAIKLTLLATELHQLVWSHPENCFAFSVSVAEAQLRRLAPRRSEGTPTW
jgi:hypothetical protein